MWSPFLLLAFVFSALVGAAPKEVFIGPEKLIEEESAATTCQTAILRCCTPNTPTTDATWRCFEKNSCGGLFVVHTNDTVTNVALGACAFLSKVKDLVAEEKNSESLVSVRNEGRPKENIDEENLPKTKAGDSKQKSKGQEMDKIVDLPRKQQHPSLISKLCLGGSHERCINDKEEGCGALEHLSSQHDSYVKCVHHCVEHCKRKI